VGATLFGAGSLVDAAHLKYYAGLYNGVQEGTDADALRYTGRLQANFFEAEPSYYNSSTYLGTKKTVGAGLAYDAQDAVARSDDVGDVDYRFYTADLFAEHPAGPGALTVELAYQNLDLDDARSIDLDGDPATPGRDGARAQGDGFYVQAGYYLRQWQPWVAFESWSADAPGGKGSYDMYRVGLTYFIDGHHANIKAGYEQFEADAPIGDSAEDAVGTFVLGLYLTY
jgi:hypothetical protein